MKFENLTVFGLGNALIGMRLPMCKDFTEAQEKCGEWAEKDWINSENERICKNLIKADNNGCGQPNSKFLRMIHVQVAITAPMYFFNELDTYKVGTVANSTSKMHKLASTPITMDCFEMDDFEDTVLYMTDENGLDDSISLSELWEKLIKRLERMRVLYNETKDKRYWKELIRSLPESWLQTRMFDCNYATLRNIYKWRKNHKLTEWHQFCEWIEKDLPYAKELIMK